MTVLHVDPPPFVMPVLEPARARRAAAARQQALDTIRRSARMARTHTDLDAPGDELVDYETCSWCTTEVPDACLVEQEDGARVCPPCDADGQPPVQHRGARP